MVDSVVKLPWINLSIISVKAEVCACRGSRLAFILSSTDSGESPMFLSSLLSVTPGSATSVFSFSCVDLLGCALRSYEFKLLNVLDSQERLIQSARGKLEIRPIYLLREYNFLKFTKVNLGIDVKRCIKIKGAVGCQNWNNSLWLARSLLGAFRFLSGYKLLTLRGRICAITWPMVRCNSYHRWAFLGSLVQVLIS